MKKLIASILSLTAAAALSVPAFAAEIDQDSDLKEVQTTVSASIAPTYTVTIPADVEVEFNAVSTSFGNITLEAAQIDPGHAVTVTLTASGTLKNKADETKTIAYTVSAGGAAFTSEQYETAGDSTALTIEITQEAWNAAYAGEYSDTVTFTVSYAETGSGGTV